MKIGGNASVGVQYVTSDPDGVLTAPRGTLAINTTTGDVYQNTDGATAWKSMVAVTSRWESGKYYFLPNATNSSTSATLGNGTLRLTGFDVPNSVTLDRLGAEVVTIGDVGSKVRLGIFTISGTTATLVADAGQIAGDSTGVMEKTGLSITLKPGKYYCGVAVQSASGTQPTLRTAAAGSAGEKPLGYLSAPTAGQVASGYLALGVTGAFASTITITDVHNSFARVYCKVA